MSERTSEEGRRQHTVMTGQAAVIPHTSSSPVSNGMKWELIKAGAHRSEVKSASLTTLSHCLSLSLSLSLCVCVCVCVCLPHALKKKPLYCLFSSWEHQRL